MAVFRVSEWERVSEYLLMVHQYIWTLWCKGRLTEADTPTIRLGATPSGLEVCTGQAARRPGPFLSGRADEIVFQIGPGGPKIQRAGPSRSARYILCFRIFLQHYLYFSLFFTHVNAMTSANNHSRRLIVPTAIFEIWMEQLNQRTQVADTRMLSTTPHRASRFSHNEKFTASPLPPAVCMPLGCTRTVCAVLHWQGTKS